MPRGLILTRPQANVTVTALRSESRGSRSGYRVERRWGFLGGSFEQKGRGIDEPAQHRTAPAPRAPLADASLPVETPNARGHSLLRSAPALVLFAIVVADAMRSADTD